MYSGKKVKLTVEEKELIKSKMTDEILDFERNHDGNFKMIYPTKVKKQINLSGKYWEIRSLH
jgi:hypothetical protein